jgi:hypothetical protein
VVLTERTSESWVQVWVEAEEEEAEEEVEGAERWS